MRMPVRIALVLGCLTVTGAVLIVIAGPGSRADTGPDLMTLIRSESPLPESVRREADIDTARLAQENTEFRHWLVGVVASDDVPMKTREAAMQALWHLEGDDVIRDVGAPPAKDHDDRMDLAHVIAHEIGHAGGPNIDPDTEHAEGAIMSKVAILTFPDLSPATLKRFREHATW